MSIRRSLAALVALVVVAAPAASSAQTTALSLEEVRAGYDRAVTRLEQGRADVALAEEQVVVRTRALEELQRHQADLTEAEAAAGERYRAALVEARRMAVASYVRGGNVHSAFDVVGARDLGDFLRERAGYSVAAIASATNEERLAAARDDAGTLTVAVVQSVDRVAAALGEAQRQVADAHQRTAQGEADVAAARVAFEAARVRSTVPGTDIPGIVWDAYAAAAALAEAEDPGCGVAWWVVAGVGKVESGHARGARRIRPDGTAPPIIGIPLTGEDGTALVADSDGGELDGDAELDRAVGPMQFIPGTWRRWKADGNGDGRADVFNIYDAAAAAARYLCASRDGLSLTAPAGQRAALLSYNHSDHYVAVVSAAAHGYRDAAIPTWALPLPPPAPPADGTPAT